MRAVRYLVVLLTLVLAIPVLAFQEAVEPDPELELPPVVEEIPSEEVPGEPIAPIEPPTFERPPAPTPVPTPGPGTVLLTDNFDDPTVGVLPRTVVRDDFFAQYVDREYQIRNAHPRGEIGAITVPGSYVDASIAVDVRVFGGPESSYALLGCRTARGSGYGGVILPAQQIFAILKLVDGSVRTLLDSLARDAIRPGDATNRIELSCVGPRISFAINGTFVGAVDDPSYRSGLLEIGVGGGVAEARFDNLVVTQR